jgi:predicted ATPase
MLELGRPTPADLLHMVYRVTEGNPFFVEEILRALPSGSVASDGALGRIDQLPIPRTVEEAVQQRTEQLGAESRRLLELAAAIGQRFEFGLLQELAGCSEEDLLRYLKDLVRTQLLEEPRVDEFAFHHALTREAIYHRLLGRERRTLHQRIGVALERRAGGTPEVQAAELAYHFHAAGDWNRTQKYAALAGNALLLFRRRMRPLNSSTEHSLPPDSWVQRRMQTCSSCVAALTRC